MTDIYKVTRRQFLRDTGLGAGALVLGCHLGSPGPAAAQKAAGAFSPNNFVTIHADGSVVLVAHRSEMGQGIRSSLPAVLADELGADKNRVRLVQADADHSKYGLRNPLPNNLPGDLVHGEEAQFTDSSRSMAAYFQPMRLFGATARLMLIAAAAKKMGCDPSECEAGNHAVRHKTDGRSMGFGELAAAANDAPVPQFPQVLAALKQPQDWIYIGRPDMPFWDADDMIQGKAVFGADVDPAEELGIDLPPMLTAMIEHCPVANGGVKSFDENAALAVPGVVKVVPMPFPGGVGAGFLPHAGVAVVAENTWAAWAGRRALRPTIEWDLSSPAAQFNSTYDSKAYRQQLEQSTSQPGKVVRQREDVDTAFATAAQTVEADYYVPHLAQAPLEPPVAIGLVKDGVWHIWSPTQGPQITQQYVGLAMLRPNPQDVVQWLAWPDPPEPEWLEKLPPEAQQVEGAFRQTLRGVLGGIGEAQEAGLREQLKKEIRDKVKVHVTLLGGGFGRKSKPDYAIEAAYLAAQMPGTPVRVQWTREDDIQFSYFNACAHQRLKAGLDADGDPTALLWRSAFPSFFATLFPPPVDPSVPEPVNKLFGAARAAFKNGGEFPFASAIERAQGLEDMPFDVPNIRIENCPAPSHVRGGWMRSVANIYHAFAIGSFADELAIAAKRDSKDYLLELIGDGEILPLADEGVKFFDNNQFPVMPLGVPTPVLPGYPPDTRRLRRVVEEVAAKSGWSDKAGKLGPRRGLGIAAHRSFLSYVAMVFDVSLNEANELTIHEIWGAIDCGVPVNPDRIIAQMEGGIVYGLTLALHGEITCKNGKVQQNNFDDYPMARMYQTPKAIHTSIVTDWPDDPLYQPAAAPTGVGEPPVPPVAPALCNAIVAAGGPRIRELPIFRHVTVL